MNNALHWIDGQRFVAVLVTHTTLVVALLTAMVLSF